MKLRNKVSTILLVLSLVCFAYLSYLLYERFQPQTVAFSTNVSETSQQSTGTPDGLVIPSLDISLSVFPLVYKTDWPISKQGIVNVKNSNVFYGHNWPNLLGELKDIAIGDQIQIHHTDNTVQRYKVTKIVTVWPTETQILDDTDSPDIVLYTCIGLFDTKRLVVVATPI